MKIEAGKFYWTRADKKARVYATDATERDGEAIHGAVEEVDGAWVGHCWFKEGRFFNVGTSDEDLVSEWEDTPPDVDPNAPFCPDCGHNGSVTKADGWWVCSVHSPKLASKRYVPPQAGLTSSNPTHLLQHINKLTLRVDERERKAHEQAPS